MNTDTLHYFTSTKTAFFYGPCTITSTGKDSSVIFCENGWYNTATEKSYFGKNAWLQSKEQKLWGNDDPLFPMTEVGVNAHKQFDVTGLKRKHWRTTAPVREIFRESFKKAGLPYFNPHSFRNTLACLGEKICKTPEDFKAWSQNLGHEGVMTTFLSYGQVAERRQGEILKQLAIPPHNPEADIQQLARAMMQRFRDAGINV